MGALTFTFMKVEKLEVTGHVWNPSASATTIKISVKNTGTAVITLSKVRVNGNDHTVQSGALTTYGQWNASDTTLDVGETADVFVSRPSASPTTFSSGVLYQFEIISTTNYICPYSKTAP